MFGIGTWEMVAIAVIALVVLGPDELPKFLRSASKLFNQIRNVGTEIRREAGIDDMIRKTERDVREGMRQALQATDSDERKDAASDADLSEEAQLSALEHARPAYGPDVEAIQHDLAKREAVDHSDESEHA